MSKEENFKPYIDKDGTLISGYINKITLPSGKTYGLKCEVIEIHPITCPKCGSSFELKYGNGKCEYCGTYYTTKFSLEEVG